MRSLRGELRATRDLRPPRRLRSLHRAVERSLGRVVRQFDAVAGGVGSASGKEPIERYTALQARLLRELDA